jgi:hypothetical protein
MSADPELTPPASARQFELTNDSGMEYIQLHGTVEDQPVSAVFEDGQFLIDEPLWKRADLLVAMSEVFGGEDGAISPATLDGPLIAAAVTLIRACDRVVDVKIAFRR